MHNIGKISLINTKITYAQIKKQKLIYSPEQLILFCEWVLIETHKTLFL